MQQQDTQYEERKVIFEEIKSFNRTELEELYRILIRYKEEISENKNGMVFDLNNVKQETIDAIKGWITFCKRNRASFALREKEMSELANDLRPSAS